VVTSVAVGDERRPASRSGGGQAEAEADGSADQAGPDGPALRRPVNVRKGVEAVKIQALKDSEGDYWIPRYDGDQVCLSREGHIVVTVPPDLMATSKYGPFTSVTLNITEVEDPALTCDDCLHDRHFCYACDDVVSHNHAHDDD
jgi:hypothetical protein